MPTDNSIQQKDRSVMNVTEAADYLRVSESIIRRFIRQKRIPYFQIDGRYLFFKEKVDEWVIDNIVKPSECKIELTVKKTTEEIWNKTKGR